MITYEEMKAIMKFCDEHDINYEFTNYYGFGSDEKIIGHALTIEAYLETTDLDKEDLKYMLDKRQQKCYNLYVIKRKER